MRYYFITLFIVMIAVQWFVPLGMIIGQEKILASGKVFKFKTEPVDPSDPFRGKYITLRFAATTYRKDPTMKILRNDDIYVKITEDEDGYAQIQEVTREIPEDTQDFVKAKANYVQSDSIVAVRYPFDRFYLEESKASEAEQAYWEASQDSTQIAYALVAIKNGSAALKDVILNDTSIVDIVRKLNEN